MQADTFDSEGNLKATSTEYRKLIVSDPLINKIILETDHRFQSKSSDNNDEFVVNMGAYLTVKEFRNTSTVSADSIKFGDTVDLKASAVDGSDNYTYEMLYKKKSDTKWTMIQKFTANDSVTIKPKAATDYDICIKVKDAKSGVILKKFFDLEVLRFTNTLTISTTSLPIGQTLTATAMAENGSGNYRYSVLYKKKSDTKWTTALGFGTKNQVTIKPRAMTDYDICIKVKDNNSGVIEKKFLEFNVTAPEAALVNNSTASFSNGKITANGKAQYGAAGSTSDYKYAVY